MFEDKNTNLVHFKFLPVYYLCFCRSLSDDFELLSTGSLLGESTSSCGHEGKLQKRRSEIRTWIRKQRQKRRKAQARLSASKTKLQLIASIPLDCCMGDCVHFIMSVRLLIFLILFSFLLYILFCPPSSTLCLYYVFIFDFSDILLLSC